MYQGTLDFFDRASSTSTATVAIPAAVAAE
jgi:hypothetical protein